MPPVIGIILLIVPLAFYVFYTLSIRTLYRKKKLISELIADHADVAPFVSVVIPTYNEVKMIGKRTENFDGLEYPRDRFEVIFVDGASNDGTPELIERLRAEGRPYIRLVRQPSRKGYNSAVYEGVSQARADIVVVGEVGGIWHPKGLLSAVSHFAQPSIAVVTGKSVIYNPDESLATRLEAAYRDAHDVLRYAESVIDTTPDMKGELLAFRKEIGLRLRPGETLPDSTSFDMAISYVARSLGSRATFDPNAVFFEYAPLTIIERMRVQIRRGTTFAGAVWAFRSMILNPKFGYFGLLIAPSRLLMLLVFPWLLLIASVVLAIDSLSNPWPAVILLALAGVALLYRRTRYTFLAFVLSQIVLVIASLRLALRRHTQMINTVPTTRR